MTVWDGRMTRRGFIAKTAGLVTALYGLGFTSNVARAADPIQIGIITDLTGALAPLGRAQYNMAQLAVEDINQRGGLLGRPVEIIVADMASDPAVGVQRARELVERYQVPVVAGGLTGAERDAVKNVVTRRSLYIFPTLTEGGPPECLPRMFTTGPVPEQLIDPFVPYLVEVGGTSWYFLGSDYIFPRGMNAAAKEVLQSLGGRVVGEEYYPLDATDFSAAVNRIAASGAEVIFSNVIPPSSYTLIRQLNEAGLWKRVVYATPGADEGWLTGISPELIDGLYACLDFFHSVDTPFDRQLVQLYSERFQDGTVITAAGGSTSMYRGLQLWAAAVEEAGTTAPAEVEKAMDHARTDRAPGGPAEMIPGTRHAKMPAYIGQFRGGRVETIRRIEGIVPRQCG